MKKAFMVTVCMVGIIAVRMILSVAFNEQAAEVFSRVSISILFFYFICSLSRNRLKTTNKQ